MKRIVTLGIAALILGGSGWGLYQAIQPDAHEQRLARLRQKQIPAAGAAPFCLPQAGDARRRWADHLFLLRQQADRVL